MVCDRIVHHPSIVKTVQFWDGSDTKDKVFRLLQFLCKLLYARRPSQRAKYLEYQLILVRKFLLILKPLVHLQRASMLYDDTLSSDRILRLLKVARSLCYAVYLALDNINLLRMLRLLPTTAVFEIKIPYLTKLMWLCGLLFSIASDLRNIQEVQLKLAELRTAIRTEGLSLVNRKNKIKGEVNITKTKAAIKTTTNERYCAFRRFLCDVLDTFVVLNSLGYLKSKGEYVALAGMTTSTMAIQDLWNS